jgi:plastocyanin
MLFCKPPRVVGHAMIGMTFALLTVATAEDRPKEAPKLIAVEGTVTYSGPLPKPVTVPEAGTERPLVEVHPKTRGLKDAIAHLEGVKAPGRGGEQKAAVVDQRNFFFVPHVLAIEAGQEVRFLNSDAANHGVLAASAEAKNNFNIITPPGGSSKHRFAAVKNPVKIGCPLHSGMGAWVYVFDHPYFSVTDADGKFRLPPVPPGRYTLVVRHADGGLRKRIDVVVPADRSYSVKVEFAAADLKPGP